MQLEFMLIEEEEMRRKSPRKSKGDSYLVLPIEESEKVENLPTETGDIYRDLVYHIEDTAKKYGGKKIKISKLCTEKLSEYDCIFADRADLISDGEEKNRCLKDSKKITYKRNGAMISKMSSCKNISQLCYTLHHYIEDAISSESKIPVVFYTKQY